MRVDRREFIKYCISSAAALSLPLTVVGKLEQSLAADTALPTVIWLNGANCTGCTVSLANLFSESGPQDIADLLLNTVNLAYHPTLMGAAGDLAVQQLTAATEGDYILAIDGGIPTAFNGHACLLWTEQDGTEVTAMEAVQRLAPGAQEVLSVGTCASYGGVPSSTPNPTGIVSVRELTGIPSINIPGCPTHPDWIVWTIAHLLAGETPALDYYYRPVQLYGRELHKDCPYREREEAKTFGIRNACLKELGCKGEKTKSDCPSRKWNNGTNWCIGAGNICIGCTESGFPDRFSPFYEKPEYSYRPYEKTETDPEPQPEPDPEPQPEPDPEPQPEPDPEPSASRLSIKEAEWEDDRAELKAKGNGDRGFIVTVFDDTTGQQLGAVSVTRRGNWRFRQRGVNPAPRRLRAESGGRVAYISVNIED